MQKVFLFVLTLAVFACGKTNKEEQVDLGKLKDEVIAIHDEVMPQMGALRSASIKLKDLADSISTADSVRAESYMKLSSALRNANEGMMIWMRNFEPDFKGTDAEIEKYLLDQKTRIQKVNQEMKSALEAGKKALEEATQ